MSLVITQKPSLQRRLCSVVRRERYGPYVGITVEDLDGVQPQPGQFYMLTAEHGWGREESGRPFLPRAFSVMRVDGDRLEFLVHAVGPATRCLAALEETDRLWLLGPLGNGFQPSVDKAALLVGGGIGIAPLVFLSEWLVQSERAREVRAALGFRDKQYAASSVLFDQPLIATDDGSAGHHGRVTDLLVEKTDVNPSDTVIYACGPAPMLETVRAIATDLGYDAQLALETPMACGFGSCFGCAVETSDGLIRLCLEGPVLDAKALLEGAITRAAGEGQID